MRIKMTVIDPQLVTTRLKFRIGNAAVRNNRQPSDIAKHALVVPNPSIGRYPRH